MNSNFLFSDLQTEVTDLQTNLDQKNEYISELESKMENMLVETSKSTNKLLKEIKVQRKKFQN